MTEVTFYLRPRSGAILLNRSAFLFRLTAASTYANCYLGYLAFGYLRQQERDLLLIVTVDPVQYKLVWGKKPNLCPLFICLERPNPCTEFLVSEFILKMLYASIPESHNLFPLLFVIVSNLFSPNPEGFSFLD